MYRVVLKCSGISSDEGHIAAQDIAQNFAEHRPHHVNVTCSYADGRLTLIAENDFDPKGLALMDEFSDCLSAYLSEGHGEASVKSATTI